MGSYTGRMAPPGRPKIVSTPSISSDLISACPPFSCWLMIVSFTGVRAENEIDLPLWEVEVRTRRVGRRALRDYYEERGGRAHTADQGAMEYPGWQPANRTSRAWPRCGSARRRGRPAARRSARAARTGRPGAGGSSGRTPIAASTASGNLAGCAVARHTIGTSPRPHSRRGPHPHRGVRIEHHAGALVDVLHHDHGLVVVEAGRRPTPAERAPARPRRPSSRPSPGTRPWRRPPDDRTVRTARTAGARSCSTPGCPCSG